MYNPIGCCAEAPTRAVRRRLVALAAAGSNSTMKRTRACQKCDRSSEHNGRVWLCVWFGGPNSTAVSTRLSCERRFCVRVHTRDGALRRRTNASVLPKVLGACKAERCSLFDGRGVYDFDKRTQLGCLTRSRATETSERAGARAHTHAYTNTHTDRPTDRRRNEREPHAESRARVCKGMRIQGARVARERDREKRPHHRTEHRTSPNTDGDDDDDTHTTKTI